MSIKTNFTLMGIVFTNLGYCVAFLFVTQILHLAIPFISAIIWFTFYNAYAFYKMYTNKTYNSLAK